METRPIVCARLRGTGASSPERALVQDTERRGFVTQSKWLSRICLALAAAAIAAGTAAADTPFSPLNPFVGPDNVAVGDIIGFLDSWGNSNGGEFVTPNLTQPLNVAFTTFCVQTNEYLYFLPNNTFRVIGVSAQILQPTGDPVKDNLQPKTAFLYSQFRAGVLPGFDYLNTLGQRNADADLLQKAIWQYQGWINTENPVNNKFVAHANTYGWTSGIGDVRVLNLAWETSTLGYERGTPAQDVLTIVPIPEPVFFQLGVLSGLGGLGLFRFRRRR
jgi:hypothetical protein